MRLSAFNLTKNLKKKLTKKKLRRKLPKLQNQIDFNVKRMSEKKRNFKDNLEKENPSKSQTKMIFLKKKKKKQKKIIIIIIFP